MSSCRPHNGWQTEITNKQCLETFLGYIWPKKNLHLCNIFIGEAKVESMERELCDKEEAIRKLQNQLLKAQGLIMKYANWRSFQCFEEGNWVFLKLRSIDNIVWLKEYILSWQLD